jgi:hypothetical protein
MTFITRFIGRNRPTSPQIVTGTERERKSETIGKRVVNTAGSDVRREACARALVKQCCQQNCHIMLCVKFTKTETDLPGEEPRHASY